MPQCLSHTHITPLIHFVSRMRSGAQNCCRAGVLNRCSVSSLQIACKSILPTPSTTCPCPCPCPSCSTSSPLDIPSTILPPSHHPTCHSPYPLCTLDRLVKGRSAPSHIDSPESAAV